MTRTVSKGIGTMSDQEANLAKQEAREANAIAEVATEISISGQEDYESAGAILIEIKDRWAYFEARRKTITGAMNKAVKETNAFFKPPLAALKKAEQDIKREMAAHLARVDQEREQAIAEAAEAHEQGAPVEEVRAKLVKVEESQPSAPAGVTVREILKFEITDSEKLPRYLLKPDTTKVRNAVHDAANRGEEIPGIRTWREKSIAAGSGR